MDAPIPLDIRNLTISVGENDKRQILVDDLSLIVPPESIVALVGGSGSGKSTTVLAILRLLAPALAIEDGEIMYYGTDLLRLNEERMRAVRGKKIGMVFQEPLNAFNPLFPVGKQIEEVLKWHTPLTADERQAEVKELLDIVGISDPGRVARSYPHQLSGGMRQRAMIAQAIAADPKLIIADEPTSNLDVTLQAKIIAMFRELKDRLKLSILLISHDLGMVRHLADEVVVLQKGKVVEAGKVAAITTAPKHAYTVELMKAGE